MENRCVCCGALIPEGLQVCPNCQQTTAEGRREIKNKNIRERIRSSGEAQLTPELPEWDYEP